jgi:hypothetical protein
MGSSSCIGIQVIGVSRRFLAEAKASKLRRWQFTDTYLGASGLSDCLSILVEAGRRRQMQILVCEEKKGSSDTWVETVPLLSQKTTMENLVGSLIFAANFFVSRTSV